jgi:hypothetical protein
MRIVAKVKGHSVYTFDSLPYQIEPIVIYVAFSLPIVLVGEDPMLTKMNVLQFTLSAVLGSVIACSPTKFGESKSANTLCEGLNCNVQQNSVDITQEFKIGEGKVDILFVTDNSASMSKIQAEMAARFSGFIQNLDSKRIDYRIAITTTDLAKVSSQKLVKYYSGASYITKNDSERVTLFNYAIKRNETIACENLIISMFNYYGTSFQSASDYVRNYPTTCPSSDTRGIYTANLVVSENSSSFMRDDANLNVILISNDNVRQGNAMESLDRASTFAAMMQERYPRKYWDFNSIIVKDSTCKAQQTLRTSSGQVVMNAYGPAISGGIGTEYANLSNSSARDIENNPRPRGQVLDICETNYSNHFNNIATQITDDSRMITLRCAPSSQPSVTLKSNPTSNVPFTLNGDKLIFSLGNEGLDVVVKYSCYTGPT